MKRFAVFTTLVVVAACHDENFSNLDADLERTWPNADRTRWTYDLWQRTWTEPFFTQLYDTPEGVPPIPGFPEIIALLEEHPIGDSPEEALFRYEFSFDGMITTKSGAIGQRVVTEITAPPARRAARGDVPSALLDQLWIARPDLREKILAAGLIDRPPRARGGPLALDPLFLNGYVFEKNDDWIGGYGDLDQNVSWKYLEANLRPGYGFTMQLVPAIADDVFLRTRILPRRDVSTPAGSFEAVVTCLYVVDYGVSAVRTEFGTEMGYFGMFGYGTVDYSPDTGPVASYERLLVAREDPLPPGLAELALHLESTGQKGE